MKELSKAYEPQKYEDKIYKRWEDSGFFNPDNLEGEPYSIMMPPPNVTGILHLGHALENALMDTMVRYQRMQGKKALLLPGTDHAAVATQAKVEKLLVEEGMKNPREELGREKLLEKIREYSENSKLTILKQIRKMGTSCHWDRLAYTFDEKRNKAVNTVFKKMYDDGLIYRGHRVVNWSVKGQSTCSDDELVYVDRKAKFYTFRYSKDFPIAIATTRPETKLGDTAVAVNPKDKRYKKYIGQIFEIKNFGGSVNLKLKVIADENVDMDLGIGALGVTPAHSAIDFEMYEKQKVNNDPIDLKQVIGEDGNMTESAGGFYAGLDAVEARKKVIKWLEKEKLLENVEEIDQSVGTSDRFGDVVEALPMTQWFVNVNKPILARNNKTLKELMKEAVSIGHKGDESQKVEIIPERFEKIYYNWIDNLRDWCISRQIWWGHRIPVWYHDTCQAVDQHGKSKYYKPAFVGEIKKDKDEMYSCPNCGGGYESLNHFSQDEDTLDTWFSSGLWTFSTLNWSQSSHDYNHDMKIFHPTSWMQMGHEILFFWMARMILMSTYILDEIPFKDVYIHGMVRDKDGKKFSKSAGNGIDPIDVINEYGCDALRVSLMSGVSPGNDSRFYVEKVEGAQHLVNKLWNISRFMLMNIDNPKVDVKEPKGKTLFDEWILANFNRAIQCTTSDIENYNFSRAGERLRGFTWNELADWYLEIAKIEGNKSEILNYILNTILKLWHPFMPFVTETIWSEIYGKDNMLMVEKWPEKLGGPAFMVTESRHFDELIRPLIVNIRHKRAQNGIEAGKKINVLISAGKYKELLEDHAEVIKKLQTNINKLEIKAKVDNPGDWHSFTLGKVVVYVDLSCAIDKDKIKKEMDNLEKFKNSLDKKLSNKEFVKNAPKDVVEKEQNKLKDAENKLNKLKEQFNNLNSYENKH